MIYMWFTGKNYYNLAVEKERDSIFTTITTKWNPGFTLSSTNNFGQINHDSKRLAKCKPVRILDWKLSITHTLQQHLNFVTIHNITAIITAKVNIANITHSARRTFLSTISCTLVVAGTTLK
jgi:hypothetical protein